MCGRYVIDTDTPEMQQILAAVKGAGMYKTGEIFPGDRVPLIVGRESKPCVVLSDWGFKFNFVDKDNPTKSSSKLVFNARSETVYSRPTFASGAEKGRCVVPCSGFYEWSQIVSSEGGKNAKQKHLIQRFYKDIMYFAGVGNYYNGKHSFVIVTKPANATMAQVHDRMPLILEREQVRNYIFDDDFARALIADYSMSALSLVVS